jgi:hypothetical protein
MSNAMLFQYAIIWNPSKKEAEDGLKAKLVGEIKTVLAKSQDDVNILAARSIPEEYLDCLEQIDIAVSPF